MVFLWKNSGVMESPFKLLTPPHPPQKGGNAKAFPKKALGLVKHVDYTPPIKGNKTMTNKKTKQQDTQHIFVRMFLMKGAAGGRCSV